MPKDKIGDIANKCLNCNDSSCKSSCPLDNRIPGFISKVREGKTDEAMRIILQENPLPAITGHVCPAFCENSCVKCETGDPVLVRNIERYVAENSSVKIEIEKGTKEGRVAVVGSGPAGLAGGYFLGRAGFEVVLYERSPLIGGMMALGIPDFRLPRAILEKEVKRIKSCCSDLKTNEPVEHLDDLFDEGFDVVLYSGGLHEPKWMNIPGEDLKGVKHAIPFLKRTNLGKDSGMEGKVAVIGGGSVALDAARMAKRKGMEPILVYRRSRKEMPAYDSEVEKGVDEGVEMKFRIQPERFLGDGGKVEKIRCFRTRLLEPSNGTRRVPEKIGNSEFEIRVDGVLEAVGLKLDTGWAKTNNISLNKDGLIKVDEEENPFLTSRNKVYAAGDAVLGPSTITEAIKSSKIAVNSIKNEL